MNQFQEGALLVRWEFCLKRSDRRKHKKTRRRRRTSRGKGEKERNDAAADWTLSVDNQAGPPPGPGRVAIETERCIRSSWEAHSSAVSGSNDDEDETLWWFWMRFESILIIWFLDARKYCFLMLVNVCWKNECFSITKPSKARFFYSFISPCSESNFMQLLCYKKNTCFRFSLFVLKYFNII